MTHVSTHLMFQGNAIDALDRSSTVFPDFTFESIENYVEAAGGAPGTIRQAYVSFAAHRLIVIDRRPVHDFDFTSFLFPGRATWRMSDALIARSGLAPLMQAPKRRLQPSVMDPRPI